MVTSAPRSSASLDSADDVEYPRALATRLRNNRQSLLSRWTERAKIDIPAAGFQNRSALINSLPKLLDDIENAIRSENPKAELKLIDNESAKDHGAQRAQLQYYSLDQIVLEYALFRTVIFEILEMDAPPLRTRERDIILQAVFMAIKSSVAEFVREKEAAITEREAQIHRSNENLKITNNILREERDLREHFMRLIAHDLRNPLNAAKNNAQLITQKPESVELVRLLTKRMIDAVNRADEMLQDLLDASSLRAGKELSMKFETVNVTQLIRHTCEELATGYGNRFVLKLPESDVYLKASPSRLRRALENLLSNAVKYGFGDTPITVGLDLGETHARIWVQNFGPTIPLEEQPNLFRPFARTKAVQASDAKGWGLGLSLVSGVAHAHSGQATVESTEEGGTTFTIELPRL